MACPMLDADTCAVAVNAGVVTRVGYARSPAAIVTEGDPAAVNAALAVNEVFRLTVVAAAMPKTPTTTVWLPRVSTEGAVMVAEPPGWPDAAATGAVGSTWRYANR